MQPRCSEGHDPSRVLGIRRSAPREALHEVSRRSRVYLWTVQRKKRPVGSEQPARTEMFSAPSLHRRRRRIRPFRSNHEPANSMKLRALRARFARRRPEDPISVPIDIVYLEPLKCTCGDDWWKDLGLAKLHRDAPLRKGIHHTGGDFENTTCPMKESGFECTCGTDLTFGSGASIAMHSEGCFRRRAKEYTGLE